MQVNLWLTPIRFCLRPNRLTRVACHLAQFVNRYLLHDYPPLLSTHHYHQTSATVRRLYHADTPTHPEDMTRQIIIAVLNQGFLVL
jgi:hypothetical protein